jgi:translation initiation factor IF-2
MQVHNDQDCVLVIGDVRIKSGETKPVPESWAPRVQALVDIGALRGHGAAPKADDRPSRAMSPREIWMALSQADRDAVMAEQQNVMAMGRTVSVTSDATPADVAASVADALKAEYRKVADGIVTNDVVGSIDRVRQALKETGVPADFATCHHNTAKAWVGQCEDIDLLARLGNDENRTSVLKAIMDRIEVLTPDTKAN